MLCLPTILLDVVPQDELREKTLHGLTIRVEGIDPGWHTQPGDQALFAGSLQYTAVVKKGPSLFLHVQTLKV